MPVSTVPLKLDQASGKSASRRENLSEIKKATFTVAFMLWAFMPTHACLICRRPDS
jgi:hypothetical protein